MNFFLRALLSAAIFAAVPSLCVAQALNDSSASRYAARWDTIPQPRNAVSLADALEAANRQAVQPEAYQTGLATYYSSRTHGRMMADGTRYDRNGLFCAHRTLPFGTMVRVVNKRNGREVVVRVRDRGPFAKGRIIDLSNRAAAQLGMISAGVVKVDLYIVQPDDTTSYAAGAKTVEMP